MSYPCPFTIWDGCMGWLAFFFQKYCQTKGYLFGCSKIIPLIVGLLRPIHLRFVYQKEQSCYHLVNKHCYWTWPIDSGFSHEKLWFSRVFCLFTRGYPFLWTLAQRMRLTVLTAVLQVGFIVSPCSFPAGLSGPLHGRMELSNQNSAIWGDTTVTICNGFQAYRHSHLPQ